MTGTVNPNLPAKGDSRGVSDSRTRGSLITLRDELNALLTSENKVQDSSLASSNNAAYRTIFSANSYLGFDAAAATYLLGSQVGQLGSTAQPMVSGTTMPLSSNSLFVGPPFFYFDDADYTVAGKTLKMRLRAQVAANATKPAIKFTFGLYPVTVAGEADKFTLTLGAVASGSTIEFNEPAASTITQKEAADFTIPADGAYMLGVVTSGALTNNSVALLSAQLQTRNV